MERQGNDGIFLSCSPHSVSLGCPCEGQHPQVGSTRSPRPATAAAARASCPHPPGRWKTGPCPGPGATETPAEITDPTNRAESPTARAGQGGFSRGGAGSSARGMFPAGPTNCAEYPEAGVPPWDRGTHGARLQPQGDYPLAVGGQACGPPSWMSTVFGQSGRARPCLCVRLAASSR
jgi:hypothetical protein